MHATTMSYPNLSQDTVDALTAFFHYVDTDHDGYISILEIQAACVVDYDGNGVITQDELVKAGQQWLQYYFTAEDMDADGRITLDDLLAFNDATAGQ